MAPSRRAGMHSAKLGGAISDQTQGPQEQVPLAAVGWHCGGGLSPWLWSSATHTRGKRRPDGVSHLITVGLFPGLSLEHNHFVVRCRGRLWVWG